MKVRSRLCIAVLGSTFLKSQRNYDPTLKILVALDIPLFSLFLWSCFRPFCLNLYNKVYFQKLFFMTEKKSGSNHIWSSGRLKPPLRFMYWRYLRCFWVREQPTTSLPSTFLFFQFGSKSQQSSNYSKCDFYTYSVSPELSFKFNLWFFDRKTQPKCRNMSPFDRITG